MSAIEAVKKLAVVALLAAVAGVANAEVKLPDGNDWARGTTGERYAYVLGISNTLTIGFVSDEKRVPGNKETFTHRAVAGLGATTVEAAVNTISAWYKANPGKLNTPVVQVLWDQIGKPRLAKSR